jgi:hypothetical protein
MAAEDSLKRIEERLTRLEATLAQQPGGQGGGFTPPGGVVVDPAPYPFGGGPGGGGTWVYHPRPMPVVDPAPFPSPVVDPAPWGGGFVQVRPTLGTTFGRIGQVGDPPPIDVSRFTIPQLESSLHTINAERARLNSLETMIKQQLDKLKPQG